MALVVKAYETCRSVARKLWEEIVKSWGLISYCLPWLNAVVGVVNERLAPGVEYAIDRGAGKSWLVRYFISSAIVNSS